MIQNSIIYQPMKLTCHLRGLWKDGLVWGIGVCLNQSVMLQKLMSLTVLSHQKLYIFGGAYGSYTINHFLLVSDAYRIYNMNAWHGPLPWASVHWLVQCTLECHRNATGWPSVYWNTTGRPNEYLQGTLEHHWKNLVETAPHWNATGETLNFAAYTGTPLEGLWQPTHARHI